MHDSRVISDVLTTPTYLHPDCELSLRDVVLAPTRLEERERDREVDRVSSEPNRHSRSSSFPSADPSLPTRRASAVMRGLWDGSESIPRETRHAQSAHDHGLRHALHARAARRL